MEGIIHDLKELKRRGSGLLVVFVDNGTVSFTSTSYSDKYPNDLCLVKKAIQSVLALTMHERYFKEILRREREGLRTTQARLPAGNWRCKHRHTQTEHPDCYQRHLESILRKARKKQCATLRESR